MGKIHISKTTDCLSGMDFVDYGDGGVVVGGGGPFPTYEIICAIFTDYFCRGEKGEGENR